MTIEIKSMNHGTCASCLDRIHLRQISIPGFLKEMPNILYLFLAMDNDEDTSWFHSFDETDFTLRPLICSFSFRAVI